MKRLHQIGFFLRYVRLLTRLVGNFCNLLSLRKNLFFQHWGTLHPAFVCFTGSSCFTQKWLPFPIVLKRNEATHSIFLARLSVTATNMSLHPISGASDEQLVASAHWEKESAILRTSSFVQRRFMLISPATVKENYKINKTLVLTMFCYWEKKKKEGSRSIQ